MSELRSRFIKAIVAPRPDGDGKLEMVDVAVPETGANEALVRMRAIGVGVHDRWFMPRDVKYPYPIGIEGAGVIEEVGEAVTGFARGDRVMFTSVMHPRGGVWAQYAAVPERALIGMPDALDFVRAAALPVAGGTALRSLQLLGIEPAGSVSTVFMAGASGAVGTMAIQLAFARGCRVAASASAANHDYLRSLGAELAVDYRDPTWTEQVLAWMPGGVDCALAIQPATSIDSMRVVRDGGTLVTVSADQFIAERGIRVATVTGSSDTQQELAALAADVAAGRIRVEVERVYPFERGVEALEKTETRHARGKVVLTLE